MSEFINKCNCALLATVASIAVGVIAAVLLFTAVITVAPAFYWVALGIAVLVAGIVTGITAANSAIFGAPWGRIMDTLLVPLIVTLGLALPMIGVAIAKAIIYYMAMYDLYTSCAPENNVAFLVLSIIFRVTEPFFIFFNRDNDKGMPPRRVTCEEV